MLVSNRGILEEIRFENIVIQPFRPELVQPVSYDVTLGPEFKVQYRAERDELVPDIDPSEDSGGYFEDVVVPKGSSIAISPGDFILGSTHEIVALGANITSSLEGKSSLGRLGLVIHATAGLIDPGFDGQITLELTNVGTMPILLWPGMKIAQLCFYRLPEPATMLYGSRAANSHYQNQAGPTTSRGHQNFKIYDVYESPNSDS